MGLYFKTVTSESSFGTRFAKEGGRTFSELQYTPASQWGREHLLACRVIRKDPQSTILPIISPFCRPVDVQYPPDIEKSIDGPKNDDIMQSEHLLVHTHGVSLGQVWAAMAMLLGPKNRRKAGNEAIAEDETKTRPKRVSRDTRQDNFVDSSSIRVGSSSPPAQSSSASSSMEYVDTESHALLWTSEDETLRFVSRVIRHLLYYTPLQKSGPLPLVVEYRDNHARLAAFTPVLKHKIVALDDGGICLREKLGHGAFEIVKNHIAILETKKCFQHIENGKPVIPDDCFAQMTCEALAARLANTRSSSEPEERYTLIWGHVIPPRASLTIYAASFSSTPRDTIFAFYIFI